MEAIKDVNANTQIWLDRESFLGPPKGAEKGFSAQRDMRIRPPEPAAGKLRAVADELVGTVFYGTLLRQMRASSLKGAYGHGGRGEEIFQAQLDQVFAQEAGRSRSTTLTDAIVKRLERQAELMADFNERRRQEIEAGQSEAALRSYGSRDHGVPQVQRTWGTREIEAARRELAVRQPTVVEKS